MIIAPFQKRRKKVQLQEAGGNGRHYIYRHIRLDKNTPFYIGVGSKYANCTNDYLRARDFGGRNKVWMGIVKNHGYRIDIIFQSDDYKEILEKEIEFISLYGRIDLGTGILSNLTGGGPGVLGMIYDTKRRKQCINNFGKKASAATRLKMSKSHKARQHKSSLNCRSKLVYQYGLDGVFLKKWYSIMDVERDLGIDNTKVSQATKKENNYAAGSYWYSEYQGDTVDTKPFISHFPVEMTDKEGNTQVFNTAQKASLFILGTKNAIPYIVSVCKGKRPHYKNLTFRYVTK